VIKYVYQVPEALDYYWGLANALYREEHDDDE
jgi:hypothetical protein